MDALSLWAISNTPVSLAIQTVLYFLSWRIQTCSMWEDSLNNTPLTILSVTSNCCKSERVTHQKHKEMAPQPAMITWWTIYLPRVSISLSSFCNIFQGAETAEESREEEKKNKLMERLIDVVVNTAKARVADLMKDEEGEGEGEVRQGKISSLIGLE